jgi:PIN domain nuclease of toxin-antitoxin system
MKVIIDTNILLFILFDDSKLSKNELEVIHNEDNEIIISSISLFEISLKYSINKLKLNNLTPDKIPDLLLKNGYVIEDIDYISYSSYYKLPSEQHKDPFDRLLIWEAIRKNYHLLSKDNAFKEYEKFGLKLI